MTRPGTGESVQIQAAQVLTAVNSADILQGFALVPADTNSLLRNTYGQNVTNNDAFARSAWSIGEVVMKLTRANGLPVEHFGAVEARELARDAKVLQIEAIDYHESYQEYRERKAWALTLAQLREASYVRAAVNADKVAR